MTLERANRACWTVRFLGLVIPILVAALLMTTCARAVEPSEPSAEGSTSIVSSAPSVPPKPVEPSGSHQDEIVVVAVGDIVCDPVDPAFDGADPSRCQHRATADLVRDADAVLVLGDLQYETGSLSAYRAAYEPSWGRFADITYPTPGNHDHATPGAEGYFTYWESKGRPTGADRGGSYSFDLGTWHVISLDSWCPSSCGEGSVQDAFLERDLARTSRVCILAFWHHPYFNSGVVHGEEMLANVHSFWDHLFASGADVVLNGHEHSYQRYGEQSPSGRAVARGIREFVVGTGGNVHYGLLERKDPNYETGDADHFGVLRLSLRDASYSWEFVGIGGSVLDRGGPTGCS